MTYEEAKARLRRSHCWGIGNECEYHMDKRGKCYSCEIGIAVESIERRIPKKPFNTEGYVDDKKVGIHYCDSCGHFVFYSDRFCNKCGQAIDWSEE